VKPLVKSKASATANHEPKSSVLHSSRGSLLGVLDEDWRRRSETFSIPLKMADCWLRRCPFRDTSKALNVAGEQIGDAAAGRGVAFALQAVDGLQIRPRIAPHRDQFWL